MQKFTEALGTNDLFLPCVYTMSAMLGPVMIHVFLQYQNDRGCNYFTCSFIAECTLVLVVSCGKKTGLGSREKKHLSCSMQLEAHEGKEKVLEEAFVVQQEGNERFSKQSPQNKSKLRKN